MCHLLIHRRPSCLRCGKYSVGECTQGECTQGECTPGCICTYINMHVLSYHWHLRKLAVCSRLKSSELTLLLSVFFKQDSNSSYNHSLISCDWTRGHLCTVKPYHWGQITTGETSQSWVDPEGAQWLAPLNLLHPQKSWGFPHLRELLRVRNPWNPEHAHPSSESLDSPAMK